MALEKHALAQLHLHMMHTVLGLIILLHVFYQLYSISPFINFTLSKHTPSETMPD